MDNDDQISCSFVTMQINLSNPATMDKIKNIFKPK